MKAHAIGGRDKPKDSYDLCYCLDHCPGGMTSLALEWAQRLSEGAVSVALDVLSEKFGSPRAFGPQQIVEFLASPIREMQDMQAQRAFQLVQNFLRLVRSASARQQR